MNFVALIILFPGLVAKICLAGLMIKTSKLDESRLVEATIDILESCYTRRWSTVCLAGPAVGTISREISSRGIVIPVTLIDETSTEENPEPMDRGSRTRLQVFVIGVIDRSTLVRTLAEVRNSTWWNHMASFLLIGWPELENGCSNAREVLWEAWKMNLLNSKFVCLQRTRGLMIYTFNPYTSEAPVPWQQEGIHKGINDHIWTLFVRLWRENESRCDGLDFDKTADLGGYEIRASGQGVENWRYEDPEKKPTIINRINNISAEILMGSLNATWKLLSHPANGSMIMDAVEDVSEERSNICLNIISLKSLNHLDGTYPFSESRLVVLTQYPGYKSQLDKFTSVLDRSSHIGLLVVLTITLLFFKYWLNKPLTLAILDLVLIICNAALPKITNSLAPRMYLGTLFIFVVTIQGVYQGKLASLLTKQVRLPNVNSVEDLSRSGYTIYGLSSYFTFFNHSGLEDRYVELEQHNCTSYVLRDPKAACADTTIRVADDAAEFKLHLSRGTMGTVSGVYLIQPDWPLEERVNAILHGALAGGIVDLLYRHELQTKLDAVRSYENQEDEPTVKILIFEHLSFAFVILGIGLGCASVTFIIEVATFDPVISGPQNRLRRMD